jgi:hypothetical protein
MADQETPKEISVNTTPVSEVKITPPQSVSVKNSMPKDGIPAEIIQVLKEISNSNGKE